MAQKGLNASYRSLAGLERTASTSRVLNLAAVAREHADEPEYAARPFFHSPVLNRSLVLKHRLRADEIELRESVRGGASATKVIIPFERSNLGLGGASLLVGQPGWVDILQELGGPGGEAGLAHDRMMLECLDELPSLDPFLLREHLRRKGLKIADCYFSIAPADLERMQNFVSREVARLINLAYSGQRSESNTARLVAILLSSTPDDRLEPLRQTLRLEGHSYREGIFCWKGFLYYKWVLSTLMDPLKDVVNEIGRLQVVGPSNSEVAAFITTSRARLQRTIQNRCKDVRDILRRYDDAFQRLTEEGDATAFRDFLLESPVLFLELGERIGMISHIATFWRFRFPAGAVLKTSVEDALDLLHDFETSLAPPTLYLAA